MYITGKDDNIVINNGTEMTNVFSKYSGFHFGKIQDLELPLRLGSKNIMNLSITHLKYKVDLFDFSFSNVNIYHHMHFLHLSM